MKQTKREKGKNEKKEQQQPCSSRKKVVNEEIFQDIQNDKSLDDANDKPESFVKPVDDREFGKDIDAGKEDMKQLICKYNSVMKLFHAVVRR